MAHFSKQHGADMHSHPHPAKRFLSSKMNELAEKRSFQRPPHLPKSGKVAELENPDVDENGTKPSHSYYDDDHEDEESLEKAHNVSVYGNPLWSEEHNCCYTRERRSLDAVALDRHDDNLVINAHNQEVLEEEDGCQSISVLPQSDYLMYTSESSDGEDFHRNCNRDVPYWRPPFHDVESRSTSQNSSNLEFNPSLESKDFYEQQEPIQSNLKASNLPHARRILCSDKGNFNRFEDLTKESCVPREEASQDFLKGRMIPKHEKNKVFGSGPSECLRNSQGWLENILETFYKEGNDLKKFRPEQCNAMPKNASDPTRDKSCVIPHQPQYDLAASDGKNMFASILANNRQGMFWSNENLKKDMSTLSPQEEDYLYQNSDLLASFEVEDHGTTKKRIAKEIKLAKEGLLQNVCEGYEIKSLQKNASTKHEDVKKEFCDVDKTKEKAHMLNKMKETRYFDDTSSWSSQNSKELNPPTYAEDIRTAFDEFNIKDSVNLAMKRGEDNLPLDKNAATVLASVDIAHSCTTLPCHRDDKALLRMPQEPDVMKKMTTENNSSPRESAEPNSVAPHERLAGKPSTSRPQKFHKMEEVTKESNMIMVERDTEEFEKEIFELKKENARLMKLLKESEEKLDNFANERVLWEQKKLSEMSIFNEFKENETQRLKRERTKVEKQIKLLAQLPSKKERNEIEELRARIANLTSEHAKKDSLQNLTINRLRRTITDLTEQIDSLQEEVRRYERFLHSELDANEDTRKKLNLPKVTVAEKMQMISSQHVQGELSPRNHLSNHTKSQNGANGSRVSTVMHWTRA